ncbi:MAG: FUSC family membrane protein [Arachidicoccus sp.]|nr:FUSC family membrane protein [Arachidicoccus sp.]
MQIKMQSLTEVRKFMNGYYWYFGLRLAFAVLLPSFILYHYGLLNQYAIIPFGTLQIGLTDVVGALNRRVGALLIGIGCFFFCAIIAGYTRDILWLQLIVLLVLAFVFSLMGIYGTRMLNIGMTSIVAAIFFMDKHFVSGNILHTALWMSVGCLIYLFIFFISYKLRPYKLIQQMLGEHIIEVSKYLKARSNFYNKDMNEQLLMDKIMREQITIGEQQESLREIILKTDVSADKFSSKSRGLLLMFVDVIDLFELIMTSQQDYKKLHNSFDNTRILTYFGKYILVLADELQHIGFAVQSGRTAMPKRDLNALYNRVSAVFYSFRKENMNHDNVEDFISLRQILYTLQSLNERIKKLYSIAAFNKDVLQAFHSTPNDYASFIPVQNYDYKLFFDSFSFSSGMFRHAIRLTVAILIGWVIGNVFKIYNIGHIYWILMTIVIVVKPAYSQSRKKNIDRIAGTLVGGIISFFIVMTVRNETAIFILVVLATLITCSFSKINYRFYSIGITMLVVLSYYFLVPNAITLVLRERLLNSVVGVIIGYLVSLFVLPNWENKYVRNYLHNMVQESKNYFSEVSNVLIKGSYDTVNIKLARRKTLIALANLSDNFQRMQSDPKKQQHKARILFRLVSLNHTLTSYIVSLAQYAKESDHKYPAEEFENIISQIKNNYDIVAAIEEDKLLVTKLKPMLPDNEHLNKLLQEARVRLKSDEEKEKTISIRKTVTDFRTIYELFSLINTSVCDEGKVINDFEF